MRSYHLRLRVFFLIKQSTDEKYDWLVVGAGFTGAVVAERLASELGARVLLIDERNYLGGNAGDATTSGGLTYHLHGPHIFHTNSEMVFSYLSRFTEWRTYEHRVLGLVHDRLVPIPFNFTSLDILWPAADAELIKGDLIAEYDYGMRVPILQLLKSRSTRIKDIAEFVFEHVFQGYTLKQWGLPADKLASSILSRVPFTISYDDRYFNDKYQAMPLDGYTALFERLLSDKHIDVRLNCTYDPSFERISRHILYTGAIDRFFNYELGELPYRSLSFDVATYRQRQHQPVAQVNYPGSQEFTRITEMSHITGQVGNETVVLIEYPLPHHPGLNTPYYPVPSDDNSALHRAYLDLAAQRVPNVIFAGRLGRYQYMNMDQAVAAALALFTKKIRHI